MRPKKVTDKFKQSIARTSFDKRVLEPESMEETAEDYAGMDFRKSNGAFIKLMSPMIPHGSKVVDFGCGPGDITVLLAKARPDLKITGVDLSRSMLTLAKRNAKNAKVKVNWKVGDMTKSLFEKGEIDFAFSHTTLHHLKDLGPFFKQMKRSLRPGGGFCIRDLRRPETATKAMEWIYEATKDGLTQRQYELFFYSLRASLTLEEIRSVIRRVGIKGTLKIPQNPKRYWVFWRRAINTA